MAFNKLFVMLPLMYLSRKIDGEDPNMVLLLRCAYFGVQFFIALAVIYIYLTAQKIAKSKFKDLVIFVPPPPQPLAGPDAKVQYKQTTFGEHAASTAKSLLTSTLFGIAITSGLHFYKGMIVGLAMQSIMGPLNLFENKFAKAILFGGEFKEGDTPKSRKMFDEKYREEMTKDDEVVDAEGKILVLSKKDAKDAKKSSKAPTFEEILLDTWDEGDKADVTAVMTALNKNNANFKTKENGWTPLMVMAAIGAEKAEDVIKKLKELGANASIVDGEGWNALHWAAFHGSASGAKFVLEVYGTKAGLQDVKDKEGKTPLQHAKDEGNDDVAKAIEEATSAADTAGIADKDGLRKRK